MRYETAVAIQASEGLALVSVSRQQALELIIGAFVLIGFFVFCCLFFNLRVFIKK